MDIREEILKEHSKEKALEIMQYIGNDPERIAEMMELFLHDENYRVNQRIAWVVGHVAERYPSMFIPYLPAMIKNLDHPSHDAGIRNTVRIWQDIDIPEPLMGEIADRCFTYLTSPQAPIAVRVFSMTVLFNITKTWPELGHELVQIIEEHLPYGSAGFKSRGKKIIAAIRKTL